VAKKKSPAKGAKGCFGRNAQKLPYFEGKKSQKSPYFRQLVVEEVLSQPLRKR
jgi:hypothetical protein